VAIRFKTIFTSFYRIIKREKGRFWRVFGGIYSGLAGVEDYCFDAI
jgi:hypothetical protein